MTFYGRLADTATRLLTKFGAKGQLRRVGGISYDPATGGVTDTDGSAADEDVIAVVLDYKEGVVDGTVIRVGDKQAYVSVKGVAPPGPSDLFLWQGDTYSIISPKELAPAGERVIYEWQVRK